jgi:hypothetical protein
MPHLASPLTISVVSIVSIGAGHDVYAAAFAVEDDLAVDEREQGVIFALADTFAGVELGAQLANDDVASDNFLAAETLDAAALTVGIATVAAGALTFFMCHGGSTLRAKPQANEAQMR